MSESSKSDQPRIGGLHHTSCVSTWAFFSETNDAVRRSRCCTLILTQTQLCVVLNHCLIAKVFSMRSICSFLSKVSLPAHHCKLLPASL
jgi:hypothetical protein